VARKRGLPLLELPGQLLPPPSASVVQYGYFRGGGYLPDAAGLAALGSFIFPTIGRFLLPLVALVLLLVTGEVSGTILLAGALSLAISVIAGIAGYCFLRDERSARWLGAKLRRPLSWILVKLKRDPIEDGAGKAAQLRAHALAVLREGWALGSIGVAANLFLTYLILLASLRFVGVSANELSAVEAFAAFAVAFWAGRSSRSRAAASGWWTPFSSRCSSSSAAPRTTRSWPLRSSGASSTPASRCRSALSRWDGSAARTPTSSGAGR
jgi:hypothetical protein